MVKSEVIENKKQEKEEIYPCLKMATTTTKKIVLFIEKSCGTVVGNSTIIGRYSESWDMNYFTNFDGQVTLSNSE